jgi:hypothetical protein
MNFKTHLLRNYGLSQTINEIKPTLNVFKTAVFGRSKAEPLASDLYKYQVNVRDILFSHFVMENTSAIIVGEGKGEWRYAQVPHQRIKSAVHPADIFREAGVQPFDINDTNSTAGRIAAGALENRIEEIMANHARRMDHTEELMCAQAITGVFQYSPNDHEASFEIDYGRPAANTIALAGPTLWSAVTRNILANFRAAKKVAASSGDNAKINEAYMSPGAAEMFLADPDIKALLDNRRISIGELDLNGDQDDAGSRSYLGKILGIRCYEVDQSFVIGGVTTQLIRAGYVEFVANNPDNGMGLVYAPITDFDSIDNKDGSVEIRGGNYRARRFAKSWRTPDPSGAWIMSATSVAPKMKKAGVTVSMKVL